jgi:hypothetical protein
VDSDFEIAMIDHGASEAELGRQIAPPKSTTPFQKRSIVQIMIAINSVPARADASSQ